MYFWHLPKTGGTTFGIWLRRQYPRKLVLPANSRLELRDPAPGMPSHWMPYVIVEDVAASTAKAKSLGATVLLENMEVPDTGRLSVITDPAGAHIGMFQPKR